MAPHNNKKRRISDIEAPAVVDVHTVSDTTTPSTAIPAAAVVDDGTTPASSEPSRKRQQQRRSLFVRSLPSSATTESLIEHFSQNFPIKHATAVMDNATKKCKGYGFITFADADDAVRAVAEFQDSLFEGRRLKLEIAEPRKRDVEDDNGVAAAIAADGNAGGAKRGKSQPSAAAIAAKEKREKEKEEAYKAPKLIVRNLPWSIKKPEQLAELFRMYGKVRHATLPSKKPGLLSGFGFVVLRGKKNAEKALEGVNGKEVDGRVLAVDYAVEKEVWKEQEGGKEEDEVAAEKEAANVQDEEVENSGYEDEDASEDIDEDTEEDDDDEDEDEDENNEESEDEDDEIDNEAEDKSLTIFIRNTPFTATDESLHAHFTENFGPVRYARVVMDPQTERPRGTAFVCFYDNDIANACLRYAPTSSISGPSPHMTVLQNHDSDPTGKYTLDGRVLQLSRAVSKNEASRLTEAGVVHRHDRDKDKRHLYLLSEGTISSSAALYATLSPAEIAMREASLKQRKTLIQSNPTLHLSLTRLSVRNLPRSITSKDLKSLAREAVVGFAVDVKAGRRERLNNEELRRGGDAMMLAEKARKAKGTGIVKQAKVVFEGREGGKVGEESGAGRSRGYGFIEYHSHRSALMGLRWLNGHAIEYVSKEANGKKQKIEVGERKKRLIVEFAIENAQVVMRRAQKEVKAREAPKQGEVERGEDANRTKVSENKGPKRGRGGKKDRMARERRDGKVGATGPKNGVAPGKKREAKELSKPDEKLAVRTRIIAKKRAVRRDRNKVAA